MKTFILAVATAGAAIAAAAPASAQLVNNTSFRGLRAEGQVGYDKFMSQGTNNEKFGYGGAIGFDGQIGDKIVIGPEGSYWRANEWTSNRTAGVRPGSTVDYRSFEEWGVAVRAGYLVTPKVLVYGKAGYVSNEFRKRFTPATTLPRETAFRDVGRTDGYQVGGGVEYSLTDMFYVNGEYKYSNYNNNTARQRAMLGFGLRFNPGF